MGVKRAAKTIARAQTVNEGGVNAMDAMNGANTDTLLDLIGQRLVVLEPQTLDIIDESHLHAGHAGAKNGARHIRLRLRSAQFQGKSTLARHRLVYDILADLMPHPIHALALELDTPGVS